MTFNIPQRLQTALERLYKNNITSYFVGGCVRDQFMGVESDDIDICLVGELDLGLLREFLAPYCDKITEEVGKSFSVLIATIDGKKYDFALARTEKSTGAGHKDFSVEFEGVTIEMDLARRDLTINAVAVNCITGEIIDPFNGRLDIKYLIARPTTIAFMEDPLRIYRAARFIARFGLTPAPELFHMCEAMNLSKISNERVGMELKKMFFQAIRPSDFFRFLLRCGKLQDHFPEVAILCSIEQDAIWHPEGNVFEHTMYCMDAAESPFIRCVMLCHDLGKATTTIFKDGRWKAPGHAAEGVKPTYDMLSRLSFMDNPYQKQVATLVHNHMFHTNQKFTKRAVVRMIRKLTDGGVNFTDLVEVCRCDVSGRPPLVGFTPNIGQDIAEGVILKNQVTRIVTGGMLITLGFEQGRKLGMMLQIFENMQDRDEISSKSWEEMVPTVELVSDIFLED